MATHIQPTPEATEELYSIKPAYTTKIFFSFDREDCLEIVFDTFTKFKEDPIVIGRRWHLVEGDEKTHFVLLAHSTTELKTTRGNIIRYIKRYKGYQFMREV